MKSAVNSTGFWGVLDAGFFWTVSFLVFGMWFGYFVFGAWLENRMLTMD